MTKVSEEIPSRQEQVKQIKNAWKSKLSIGEKWYVIDIKWFKNWMNYSGFKHDEKKAEEDEDNDENVSAPSPGPIENDALSSDDVEYVLKKGVQERIDFELINEEVWTLLYEWFGGGPVFKRHVYGVGVIDEPRVDLYPVFLDCVWLDEDGKPNESTLKRLAFRRTETFTDVCKRLLSLECSDNDGGDDEGGGEGEGKYDTDDLKVRVWRQEEEDDNDDEGNKDDDNTNDGGVVVPKWIVVRGEAMDEQLGNLQLKAGTTVWVDRQKDDNTWCKDHIKRNWQEFAVGDIVDALDTSKKWYESTILEVDDENETVRVHYNGWESKWDETLPWDSDRLAMQSTHTNGPYRPRKKTSNYSRGGGGGGSYYSNNYYSGGGYTSSWSRNEEGTPPAKGAVGLRNLGNTCFMNSTIQCMSNSPHVTDYFVSNAYENEINRDNPLGWKGRVADEYGSLMKNMWSGKYTVVSPSDFKRVLGEFQPRFSGYEQQDSSELLGFLLDGLHEDLNLVKKKPMTETVESDGRPDAIVAKEAWDTFLLRNKSIIVNTYQGQFKSTLVCPQCNRTSITFDPFRFVSVPLPVDEDDQIQQEVTVVFADSSRPLTIMKPVVTKVSRIIDLLNAVSELTETPANTLVCADVWNSKIYRIFKDDELVSSISSGDTIYIYELPTLGTYKPRTYRLGKVSFITRGQYSPSTKGLPTIFILPLKEEVSGSFLMNQIRPHIQRSSKVDLEDNMFVVSVSSYSRTTTIVEDTDDTVKFESEYSTALSIEWEKEFEHVFMDELVVEKHTTMSDKLDKSEKLQALTLQQCLKEYTKGEKLGENDAWYCRVCKEHVQAFKQMELYKTPDILIVHLKRFNFSRYHRDKISKLVEFPLEGLNMNEFCTGATDDDDDNNTYSLFAVSNHMGGLGGGHYTAYCKNLEDGNWYCHDDSSCRRVNTDNIVSSAAYVLFYHRTNPHENPIANGGDA